MKSESDNRLSELKLERYVSGDLPPGEMARIRRLAEDDAQLQRQIAELTRSNEQILADRPPEWVARQIRRRLGGRPARAPISVSWKWLIPALPALAAVALLVIPRDSALDPPAWTGLKGIEPHLMLYRKSENGAEHLEDGAKAREGDRIQMVYRAGGKRYGLIFSIDGRGQVTGHLPATGKRSTKLKAAGPDTLNFAYRLDDAPHLERFYFIAADEPFEAHVMFEEARRAIATDDSISAERLPLSENFRQHVQTLTKE